MREKSNSVRIVRCRGTGGENSRKGKPAILRTSKKVVRSGQRRREDPGKETIWDTTTQKKKTFRRRKAPYYNSSGKHIRQRKKNLSLHRKRPTRGGLVRKGNQKKGKHLGRMRPRGKVAEADNQKKLTPKKVRDPQKRRRERDSPGGTSRGKN